MEESILENLDQIFLLSKKTDESMGTIGLSEYSSPHLPLPAPLGDWGGGGLEGAEPFFRMFI